VGELHSTMLRCGYRYLTSKQLKVYLHLSDISNSHKVYIKEFETLEGTFSIALIFTHDPYTSLPIAYILNKPKHLENVLLAHVNSGWYLCYVEEREADWNPNDLFEIYATVDSQIQHTLNNSIESLRNNQLELIELEGEFSAYWKPELVIYCLSNFASINYKTVSLTTNKSNSNSKLKETVLYYNTEVENYKNWSTQRNLEEFDIKKLHVFLVKVRPTHLSGIHWPPQNSTQFFAWLTIVDHNAKAQLVKYFVENTYKHNLILLEVEKQDTIGLILELNQEAVQLNSYANANKIAKKGRKIKLDRVSSVLAGKNAFNKFQRVSFIKADQETIISRNRSRPEIGNLSKKRIALIGCGTIGGYVAELLIRSGGGIGNGHLHLYDYDTYGPQNFGRHTLNTYDFGKNKALALKERLATSTHLKTNIKSFKIDFLLEPEILAKYDLIIDATGRPPISKRLAFLLRKITQPNKPIIIHGFNDGNGLASKVFIDYLDGCYNCLCSDNKFFENGNDKRFNDLLKVNAKRVSCGNTYTPYDASVSVITAALVQEACLSTLETSRNWNYKEHLFLGGRTSKPKLITSKPFCDICNAK